jgi:CelD/BcsL family acetyltransferase involved in cellulose biosynthesis
MNGWKVIQLDKDLGSHAAAWDALNGSRFGNHPLLSSLFVNGLLRHFGKNNEYLCLFEEGGSVQAMLILSQRDMFTWATFLPSQAQLGLTMVPDTRTLDQLWARLPGTVLQLDLLCNDPQVGAVLHDTHPPIHRLAHAYTVNIDLAGTFADYWEARPRQLIKNLRRYEHRVADDGLERRVVRHTGLDEVEQAVQRYARVEGSGWKGRRGTALGSTREQFEFYSDLMLGAAARGQALVYELWLGEQLASSRLVLREGAMLVILKTCYDESLARYAPGRQLLRAVIEDAFVTSPGGTLELYTDASSDQLEWSGSSRWIEHRTLFRNRVADVANHAVKALRGPRRQRARRAEDHPRDKPADATVEVYSHPDELPEDARSFLQEAETRNIEFGLDWYRNLVRTVYPDHQGLRLYTLRRGGRVVALLPLRLERSWFGWRAHSLSNFYTTLYEPVLAPNVKGADLLPLLDALNAAHRGLGSLMLSPMAPGSHAYLVLLEALYLSRWFPFEYFAFGNWYEPVRQTWQEYLATRKSNVRSTIKRMSKKFGADGGVLEVVTRPEDMARGIAAYEKVYAASWKQPEPFQDFMPGLIQTCAEKGILRLGVAWLDGEPVAAQAWIVAHGRAEIYKVAYDEEFKQYSPGTLVTALLIEHVMEVDRVTEIDYLIGDDAYKKTWMSERRERWGIVAYNLRSVSGLSGFLAEVLRRTVKHLRKARHRKSEAVEPSPVTQPIAAAAKPSSSAT